MPSPTGKSGCDSPHPVTPTATAAVPSPTKKGGARAGSVARQGQRDADGEPFAAPVADQEETGRVAVSPAHVVDNFRIDSPTYVLRSR